MLTGLFKLGNKWCNFYWDLFSNLKEKCSIYSLISIINLKNKKIIYLKCTAQCNCVSGLCSLGCGTYDNAWSTGGSKCLSDSDVIKIILQIYSKSLIKMN